MPEGTPTDIDTRTGQYEALTFESASAELIAMGEKLMRENSERDKRKYHTIEHPRTLERRAEKVAEVFGLTEKQKTIVRIAIAWHDTIINFTPADPNDITARITRHRGARLGDNPSGALGNEALSARAMELEMRKMNDRAGQVLFTPEDLKIAFLAVEATYPGVDIGPIIDNVPQGAAFKEYKYYDKIVEQNPRMAEIIDHLEREGVTRGFLFWQPHLENLLESEEEVPPEVFVMVLDDLGGAGMATPEKFAREGDLEFQELYANISNPENLQRLSEGDAEVDETDRQNATGEMLGWLESQTSFAAWQMLRIEKIIYLLKKNGRVDERKASELRSVFDRFESNINMSLERSRRVKREYSEIRDSREAFKYLAREMHYTI